VFILALNNFAVPAILQVKVLPAEVWVEFNAKLDNLAALRTGWPLIAAAGLLLWLISRHTELAWPRQGRPFTAALLRQQLGAGVGGTCACLAMMALFISVIIPLTELLAGVKTWSQLASVEAAGWDALFNSFWLAASTATLVTILGVATGLLFPKTSGAPRWAMLVWLPFFVPGVLLGIVLIHGLNRGFLMALYQSPMIMLLALACRYAAPGWHGALLAVAGADRDLVDAGRLMGARGLGLFRLAIWPQAATQLAAAWYVVYLLCLWDVETLVLIQPPGGETLALRAFNLLHYGHNAQVNALCLWLLILAVLPLMAAAGWRWWRRN
jgi:ABC-type Fe3+ transport system permease subunit